MKHYLGPTSDRLARWALIVLAALALAAACDSAYAAATDWRDEITAPSTPVDVLRADIPDVECLALNIYHEARGERRLGRQIVAQVTINRTLHPHYPGQPSEPLAAGRLQPTGVCAVVKQITRSARTGRKVPQFSWTLDRKSDRATNPEAWRDAYIMAIEFLFLGEQADVYMATLLIAYHASSIDPGWHDLVAVIRYGGHIFYVRRLDYTAATT